MDALLLVLVLAAGDAASQSAAAAVAAALRAEPALTVVGAPASHAALAERGLSDRDLVQRSERVRDVTLADPRLAIVRVERREAGADGIIDIEIWTRGQRVPVIVAGGAARDPLLLSLIHI
ncbi:MAG: hypothetical protein N3B15_09440 [Planctomycetota bacterium]|nr:hypothetical protein [Planctomycetota bacterium]